MDCNPIIFMSAYWRLDSEIMKASLQRYGVSSVYKKKNWGPKLEGEKKLRKEMEDKYIRRLETERFENRLFLNFLDALNDILSL